MILAAALVVFAQVPTEPPLLEVPWTDPPLVQADVPTVAAEAVEPEPKQRHVAISLAPVNLSWANLNVETEVRLAKYVSAYAWGEVAPSPRLYLASQLGVRCYPMGNALNGFFFELHGRIGGFRGAPLQLGAGTDIGGTHRFGQSGFYTLWSVGLDIGNASWGMNGEGNGAPRAYPYFNPNTRFMIGYQF